MTNEELVFQIQEGQRELIPQLWEQVERFIVKQANRYLDSYFEDSRQYVQDLINESYFRMLDAIEGYRAEKGKFLTYFKYFLNEGFKVALFGGRSKHYLDDPINNALPIDSPVGDDTEGITIADMIIDKTATDYFLIAENESFWRTVGVFLKESIEKIPDGDARQLFRTMYANDCGCGEACKILDWNRKRGSAAQYKGKVQLNRYFNCSGVKNQIILLALDDYIPVSGSGITAYRNRGNMSIVESTAIKREAAAERMEANRLLI